MFSVARLSFDLSILTPEAHQFLTFAVNGEFIPGFMYLRFPAFEFGRVGVGQSEPRVNVIGYDSIMVKDPIYGQGATSIE